MACSVISNNGRARPARSRRLRGGGPHPQFPACGDRECGVSVSSLSQRLRDLEERLGVRLMNRTTRSVALTEAGELLLSRRRLRRCATSAMRWIRCAACARWPRAACASTRRRRRSTSCWRRWSGRSSRAYPQVDLEIVSESGFVDIVSAGFDAGVRYGEHLAQDMVAVPLSGPQRYVVVASPAYIARRGTPKHPKDLLDHDCIRARYSSGVMHDLEFEKAGQIVKVDPPAKLISTNIGPCDARCARRRRHLGDARWLCP